MIFTTTLSLVLALAPTTLFAAPTPASDSIVSLVTRQGPPNPPSPAKPIIDELKKADALCDLSKVTLPVAPTPLPGVKEGNTLRHIAIGRGTQNYTCASASKDVVPVANGAIASLFNATCDYARLNEKVMVDVTNLARHYAIPKGPEADSRLSGHHEFTDKKVPLFKLKTDKVDYGYVMALPDIVKSDAPKDPANKNGSVPWLKLNGVEGDYKEVYRVHTSGGVAPKTCEGIEGAFTVEYSAQYWFYA